MTALAADRKTREQVGDIVAYPVSATETIYLGSIVCLDTDGYAVPGADTADFLFVGIAVEQADNSGGADADISVKVSRTGIHTLIAASLAVTTVGTLYYIVDDQTVAIAATTTNDVLVGRHAVFTTATEANIELMPATKAVS